MYAVCSNFQNGAHEVFASLPPSFESEFKIRFLLRAKKDIAETYESVYYLSIQEK
jgi:hypothetical protein